jgi:transcriptional regulator GlxA family with amidase domain
VRRDIVTILGRMAVSPLASPTTPDEQAAAAAALALGRLYAAAARVVEHAFHHQISEAEVADRVGAKPEEITRAYAEIADTTVVEHQTRLRLDLTARLLRTLPDIPAALVGRVAGNDGEQGPQQTESERLERRERPRRRPAASSAAVPPLTADGVLRLARLYASAVRIVEHEYHRPSLTAEEVAERIGSSPREVSRAYSEIGATSWGEHATVMRVELAAHLLRQLPNVRVAEIAHAVGYSSESTLGPIFLQHYGLRPSHFRFIALHPELADELLAWRESGGAGNDPS